MSIPDHDRHPVDPRKVDGLLVIVPCGQRKIWEKQPDAGATVARDAYVGSPFTVNRRFAESFGESWLILSAKYGFIEPDFVIPGPYDTTFKRKSSGPISTERLQAQVRERDLDRYEHVIGLGGKEYRRAVEAAFEGTAVQLHFPFFGLRVGEAMQAINRAVAEGRPFGSGKEGT
jgi:hypothetical protein